MRLLLVLTSLCLVGCTYLPSLKIGKDRVTAPRDAGSPATLNKDEVKTTLDVPANTTVVTTQVAATPATDKSPAMPAYTTTEWRFLAPTKFEQTAVGLLASTGTVDTSVAKHRIDAAERRWLLWAAIGCGIGGILVRSLLPAWPAMSNGLLLAAALAGLSWKFSELPAWLWATVIGGAVLLIVGYKRAEWDANKDGVPDFLQR